MSKTLPGDSDVPPDLKEKLLGAIESYDLNESTAYKILSVIYTKEEHQHRDEIHKILEDEARENRA